MALVRTWQTIMNERLISDADQITRCRKSVHAIYAALTNPALTGKWTEVGSSDGHTGGGGMGVTGILGGQTFNAANWIYHTPTNNHSWVCLQSPTGLAPGGGSLYLTISYNYSSSWQESMNLYLSWAIPTGGATNADPTFPTPTIKLSDYTNGGTYLYNPGAQSNWSTHVIMAATGEFWLTASWDAVPNFTGFISVQRMTDLRTGDTQDVCVGHRWLTGSARIADNYVMDYWQVRSSDGSVQSVNVMPPAYGSGRTANLDIYTTDVTEGKPLSWPVYLFCPAVGQRTVKGRIVDLQLTFGNPGDGVLQPGLSPFERVVMGRFWLPGDTSPVF